MRVEQRSDRVEAGVLSSSVALLSLSTPHSLVVFDPPSRVPRNRNPQQASKRRKGRAGYLQLNVAPMTKTSNDAENSNCGLLEITLMWLEKFSIGLDTSHPLQDHLVSSNTVDEVSFHSLSYLFLDNTVLCLELLWNDQRDR